VNLEMKVDVQPAVARLDRLPAAVRSQLRPAVIRTTQMVANQVIHNLSGAVLNKRTGRLISSLRQEMRESPTEIYGRVWMDMAVAPYARIHEYGGTIKHPGSNKFQAWQGPTGWVYTHRTRPHDIPIPERSYLRSALDTMRDQVVAELTRAVRVGAREAA